MPLEVTARGDVRFRAGSANTEEIDPVKNPASPPNTVEAITLLPPLRSHKQSANDTTQQRTQPVGQ
jgi:hypothetical protein